MSTRMSITHSTNNPDFWSDACSMQFTPADFAMQRANHCEPMLKPHDAPDETVTGHSRHNLTGAFYFNQSGIH